MKVDMVMPQMGESIAEGKILKWHKKVGDKVSKDETVLEISTDKVDSEIPSPSSGIIAELIVPEGTTVLVGSLIARIETDATASISPQSTPPPTAAPKAEDHKPAAVAASQPAAKPSSGGAVIDMVMPQMGESIAEGKVLKWHKKVGDKVTKDETVLEISTDKVDSEIPSPATGVITEILVPEGTTVLVGALIARIGGEGSAAATATVAPTPKNEPAMHFSSSIEDFQKQNQSAAKPVAATAVHAGSGMLKGGNGERFYSPLVRSIAKTEGLSVQELESIPGTGLNHRVSKNDVLAYLTKRPKSGMTTSAFTTAASVPAKQVTEVKFGFNKERSELIEMNNIRKLTADYMRRSLDTSAHVYSMTEIDMSRIVKFRDKNKAAFEKREGFKLTFTPFLIDAMVKAIKDFPMINISVNGTTIIKKNYINVGMAVSIDNNTALIVPVIKDADSMNMTGICRAANDVALRARSKKLKPDEIQDGTITLTNMGVFGTTVGFPIINQPQVAIMGVGTIKKRAVVIENEEGEDSIVIRPIMYASLSYDHRVVDGALGGQYLQRVAFHLENFDLNQSV